MVTLVPPKALINKPPLARTEQSWYSLKASANHCVDIYIYDDIGAWGITAKQFSEELSTIARNANQINCYVHSLGGDVFDGIAIYNMLKKHPAQVNMYIVGIAASIASMIVMAGDTVYIPENGWIMIHKPWSVIGGNADDMREYADFLDQFEESLLNAYMAKSGKNKEELEDLLRAETWLMGQDAVDAGFADQVTDALEMEASITSKRYQDFIHMPESAVNSLVNPQANGTGSTPGGDNPGTTPQAPAPQSGATPENPAPQAGTNPGNTPQNPETPPPQAGVVPAPPGNTDVSQLALQVQAALAQQNEARRTDITALFEGYNQPELLNQCLADNTCSVDMAKDRLLAHFGNQHSGANAGFHHLFVDGGDTVKAAMINMLSVRASLDDKIEDKKNPFLNMTLVECAKASLQHNGISCSGMSKMEVVAAAFTHTSSDFAIILQDVAYKAMLKGAEAAKETFMQWTTKGTLTDFKVNKRMGLDSFPSLDFIEDGAEYKYATLKGSGEGIQLATYGKLFSITRQTIINDDLDAFSRIPEYMGGAARRTVGNLVYAILLDNPKMSDGKALFHADHNNLLSASALSVESLDEADSLMALQEDSTGTVLNIEPAFLITGRTKKARATTLLNSQYDPDSQSPNKHNSAHSMATLVCDARIDKWAKKNSKPVPWFLSAGQQFDTVEVGYLDGDEAPRLEQQQGWTVDGTAFKVSIDAGCAAMSSRTMVKNPGVA